MVTILVVRVTVMVAHEMPQARRLIAAGVAAAVATLTLSGWRVSSHRQQR